MQMALKQAGHAPGDVDYINAHGTSTMADTIELGAVERMLGDAAAKVTCPRPNPRSAICWARPGRSRRSFAFWRCATRSRRRRSTSTIRRSRRKVDLAPNPSVKRKIDEVLSNSFGFGGTNASVVLERCD